MRQEESFNRLSYAFFLYLRQQNERVFFGGSSGLGEVSEENRQLAKEVLPVIERYLDEDLLDELENVGDDSSSMFTRNWSHMANLWMFPWQPPFSPRPYSRKRVPKRYADLEVNNIIADFTVDLNNRKSRESKTFTRLDLRNMIEELEKDLQEALFHDDPPITTTIG